MRTLIARTVAVLAVALTCPVAIGQQDSPAPPATELAIPNGGFEEGLAQWTVGETMSTASTEQAASGRGSLKVVDENGEYGSNALGPRVPIAGAGLYTLHGKAFPVLGSGLGIYVRVLDRDGKIIGKGDEFQTGAATAPPGQWVPFSIPVYASDAAAFLQVWVHSYNAAKVTAYLDDLSFTVAGRDALRPPWEGTYKIKPGETAKLTAADVVGPDGIVYPDWRYAGVPGGIPDVPKAAAIEDFGGKADDGLDDSDALERGAEEIGARGGGALVLGAGRYELDRPVAINRDGVVIRGAGKDKTKIVFRYGGPEKGVGFFRPLAGATVEGSTWIEAHAAPKDLRGLVISVDGQEVAKTTYYPQHWGGTFSLRSNGAAVIAKAGADGPHTLRVVAEYADGRKLSEEIAITTTRAAAKEPARVPVLPAAIMFNGVSNPGPERKLARDGKRGDTAIELQNAAGIEAGDRIRLRAPATPRWNALVRNAARWGEFRRSEFRVERVEGNTLTLNQPLRLEFPVIDGAHVQEIQPIRRCGVEDLTLEQTKEIWTSGVLFSNAWECWARRVRIIKAGQFPLYTLSAKWCEIRDCEMDDAWYRGGGGTAYVGWERSYDCLMENVTTRLMRHAPLVQWSASGNVIRNSTFHHSDAQWHSGWTSENLFENCTVHAAPVNNSGAYGYGMWASPPEDDAHGPNGPRNVVYNCRINSPKAGVWLGGMNEGWLILHSRFDAGSGPGVFLKSASFDHVIRGNVFVLREATQPAVFLATPDCVGVEIVGNRIFGGGGKAASGVIEPAVLEGNVIEPLPADAASIPEPAPEVPSIFEWQRQQPRR